LVLHGALHNCCELRGELETEERVSSLDSEAAVLLGLYARLGRNCVHQLRGSFAFAIWHQRERKLFLARDRIGEQPLFYFYHESGAFVFASRIPALLKIPQIPRRIDPAGLHLGLHFVQVPAPWTAFQDIRRVPPGTWLELTEAGLKEQRYWSVRFSRGNQVQDLATAADALKSCLDQTTCLMAGRDHLGGATLSGGLDSGAVVSSLSRAVREFPTFRVGRGPRANPAEHRSSEAIARRYGTRHHQFLLHGTAPAAHGELLSVFGEPVAMPVALDAQVLAREAQPFAKVVLTGTGGDELFAGYADHAVLRRLDRERCACQRPATTARDRNGRSPREDLLALPPGRVLGTLKFSGIHAFTDEVYGGRMSEAAAQCDPMDLCEQVFETSGANNLVDGFLAQELLLLNQYSLTSLLYADGARHGVDFRAPFLDVALLELAARIPARLKIGFCGGMWRRKRVLREAMRERLPSQTVWTPDKTGFVGASLGDQFWNSGPGAETHRYLTSPALRDYRLFDTAALERLWLVSTLGRGMPIDWFWGVASIAAWLERYF
jgi:asparagine synthase (glutamine-hydrolysing)